MGTKFVCLAGEEFAVIQLSVKQVAIQYMVPAMLLENAYVILNQAGEGNYATSVSYILAVYMELVVSRGSATVSLSGADGFVIQVQRASNLWFIYCQEM
ncbi:hypothetical protein OS493_028220 [Desmophyllum pertusum]|uniref:Uncharacterized protein n=1 Tax=Desmophyllum pertusum TaxID=174260 RepID=A0A9W9YX08_9CNID|nr:hypothetical protein OS493_028220 [Desmophyllum pertusum]